MFKKPAFCGIGELLSAAILFKLTVIAVSFGFDGTSGSFLVDDVQLEKGNGGAEYNYIENGSFNYTGSSDLSQWSGSDYTIAADTIDQSGDGSLIDPQNP